MLDDLRSSRKPESQDQPMAGASIKAVRASPDNPYAIGELRIPAIESRTKVFEGVNEAPERSVVMPNIEFKWIRRMPNIWADHPPESMTEIAQGSVLLYLAEVFPR